MHQKSMSMHPNMYYMKRQKYRRQKPSPKREFKNYLKTCMITAPSVASSFKFVFENRTQYWNFRKLTIFDIINRTSLFLTVVNLSFARLHLQFKDNRVNIQVPGIQILKQLSLDCFMDN